jgi:hypothetical protein
MARKKPIPRSQRKTIQRATQIKRDDTVKDVSVSLMDMDSTIMYYFENVIKPTVIENGETIKVPIMYSSPERWYAIQRSGFMRDSKRQVILPVIAFRRTGMEKDTTIAVDKMDPEDPKLHYTFEKKYTQKNRYDRFSVQQGLIPQKEYYNVAIPDYMILSYDFIIWTSYIEQMNKLIERINWSAGAYWGEPNRMRFRTNIESYTDATEVADKERVVRTEFSVTLNGYLIPEAFNELAGPHTGQTYLTPGQLIVNNETVATIVAAEPSEGIQQVMTTGGTASTQRIETEHPLTMNAGSGITLSADGVEFTGGSPVTQTISMNVDLVDPIFSSLTVTGNAVIQGDLTAQSYNTELVNSTVLYDSGSTKFGDDITDTHQMTGSLNISGSFLLNGSSIGADVTTFDQYTRKQFVKKNTTLIGNSTASFSAVTASAPSGMTATSEDDFLFFLNGQYMEHDALTIQQANGAFYLKVNTTSIGYVLENDDEIIAWGKFNA